MYMELSEKLAIKRHEELRGDLKGVAKAISQMGKDDPEMKEFLRQNSQAINKFVEAIGAVGSAKNPEVKVEVNSQELATMMGGFVTEIGKIMVGIDARLKQLENRPMPKKLEAVRNKFSGEIQYVTIEYNK